MKFENIKSHDNRGFIKLIFILDRRINEFEEIDNDYDFSLFIDKNKDLKKLFNYKECIKTVKSKTAITKFINDYIEVYRYLNADYFFYHMFICNQVFLDVLDAMNISYEECNIKELS